MELNLDQYKFIEHTRADGQIEVIAISTFAGKPVRGKAICAADDNYSYDNGKLLAAARCNAKIAAKRYDRSLRKINEALAAMAEAARFYDKMKHYCDDSLNALDMANRLVDNIVSEL